MATTFIGSTTTVNADAVVTKPASANLINHITMIIPSYTVAVAGNLTVKNGTTAILDISLTVANPGPLIFEDRNALQSDIGNSMEVRLLNGGVTVTQKLNVIGYVTETYQ